MFRSLSLSILFHLSIFAVTFFTLPFVKAGTILDHELSVHFSPSVFTAVQMYDQYQNKSLVLDLVLKISTDLTYAGITVGRHKEFQLQAPVDIFSPAVHSLCKCNL